MRRAPDKEVVLNLREMRIALALHDIKGVYQLLQRYGFSQRLIASMTQQSQSEISEIISKGRQVQAYDVLVRIAEGLEVPRWQMGLAYDQETMNLIQQT